MQDFSGFVVDNHRLASPRADVPCRRVSLIKAIGRWIAPPAGDRFIDLRKLILPLLGRFM
jgi:hypothetical protein